MDDWLILEKIEDAVVETEHPVQLRKIKILISNFKENFLKLTALSLERVA